jgi:hypothetical protein
VAHDPAHARRRVVRRQRLDGDRGRRQIIGEHDEASGEAHEELYIVLTRRGTFTLDGERVDAPAGTLVHVPDPTVERAAVGEAGTTILVVGAKPGEAFIPFQLGAVGRGAPVLADGGMGQGDRGARAASG